MSECPICCETYNQQLKSCITCNNSECEFKACKSCVRTYVMNSTSDPHCMSCRKTWDQDFIILNLNRTFYEHTYKEHRKKLLFEREQSKIPETMNDVSLYLMAKEKEKEICVLNKEINEYKRKILEINRKKTEVQNEVHQLRNGKSKEEIERKKFIMPCPHNDCRGFLSTAYKCEVCKKHCCSKCLADLGENKDPNHVCDEEMVKTAEYIKSTTKPCPKCGERISKIDGCDQMWCVECHTAFSWKTGLIDQGAVIHNPHYYQWQRNNNNGVVARNPGDNPCNINGNNRMYTSFYRSVLDSIKRFLEEKLCNLKTYESINDSESYMNNCWEKYFEFYSKAETIYNCIRIFNHYHYELNNIERENNRYTNNRLLRIQYIIKEISKESLENNLIASDTKRKKNIEIRNVLQLIDTIGHDIIKTIFGKFMNNNLLIENLNQNLPNMEIQEIFEIFDNVYRELEKFIDYCNDKFAVISVAHNLNVFHIRKKIRTMTFIPCNINTENDDVKKFIEKYPTKYSDICKHEKKVVLYEPSTRKFKISSIKNMKSC